MCCIGKLSHDRRGAGSIIGAVFIVLIIMSGYTFYTLNVNVTEDYTETVQDMQELDLKRNKENIEFTSVTRTSSDKLNITVKNTGSYQAHFIWLGVFNESTTPITQEYYELDVSVDPAETASNIPEENVIIADGQRYVIQLVTELGNIFSSSYPETERPYDFVDETCDSHSPSANGAHSLFSAQQLGPEGAMDTLTENNTGATADQWTSPTGYEDPGNEWSSETNAYDDNTGTYAMDDVPGGDTWSQYLVLTHSAITCGKIRYYVGRENTNIDQVQIDIYNGTWTNVYSGAGTWNAWTNVSFTETSMTKMRFRFFNAHPSQALMAYVYEADFLLTPLYKLDLEVQWINTDYDEANERLSIYGGTMGAEDILVDVWNGTAWINVFTDLSSGWNSADVSSYLASSTFTIRFRGGTETGDTVQDSWEIDATFLYVWS